MGPAARDVNRLARSVQEPADLDRDSAEIHHFSAPGVRKKSTPNAWQSRSSRAVVGEGQLRVIQDHALCHRGPHRGLPPWPHWLELAGMAMLFSRESHAAVVCACNAMIRKGWRIRRGIFDSHHPLHSSSPQQPTQAVVKRLLRDTARGLVCSSSHRSPTSYALTKTATQTSLRLRVGPLGTSLAILGKMSESHRVGCRSDHVGDVR
jgi:hypothetical protein